MYDVHKIVVCGAAGSGKSSIIYRYGKLSEISSFGVGEELKEKAIDLHDNNKKLHVNILEVQDTTRMKLFWPNLIRGSKGALIIFDLIRESTWLAVKEWKKLIDQYAGDIPVVIVGNKLDLLESCGEVIDRGQCRQYTENIDSIYIETSAKHNINIDDAFTILAKRVNNKK